MVPSALRVPLSILRAREQGLGLHGAARSARTLERARGREWCWRPGPLCRFVVGTAAGPGTRSHRGTPPDYRQRLSVAAPAHGRFGGGGLRRALPCLAAAVLPAPDDR